MVSPALTPPLAALADAGAIAWEPRRYAPGDLAGALLAFAATDDDATNAAVAADARAAGILVNDASEAARGDFATPAVHRSGPLTVTVDSSGLSPSFTKRIRDELALQFDARYARAAATLGALRERVQTVLPPERRAAVMQHFAERDVDELATMKAGAVEHEVERVADTLAGVVPAQTQPLVCATRGSRLALVQARTVMAALAKAGLPSTVLEVATRGDAVRDRSIAAIGTDNVFVKELELALREGRADYAVHSCKDLPSTLPEDMTLAAVTAREDARDAYCSERYAAFADLPPGARVGTSSPRRRAQLRALRPDLVYDDVRGNVDTRLRKLADGEYAAIVLACAGLNRLGARATHTVPFAVDEITPAVGPGRARDRDARRRRARAPAGRDPRRPGGVAGGPGGTRVPADRARRLPSADRVPCDVARRAVPHRRRHRRGRRQPGPARRNATPCSGSGDVASAEAVAVALARDLLAEGGSTLLGGGPLSGRVFLLPRTQDRPSRIAPALRDAGAEVVEAPDSATAAAGDGRPRAQRDLVSVVRLGRRDHRLSVGPARQRVTGRWSPRWDASSSATAGEHGWPPDVVAPSPEVGAFVQSVTRFVLENGA